MKHRPADKLCGGALPTALFAITLLALAASLIATLGYESTRTRRIAARAMREALLAPQALLATLTTAIPPPTRIVCTPSTKHSQDGVLHLCTVQQLHPLSSLPTIIDGRTLPRRDAFPLFDAAAIFGNVTPCTTIPRPLSGRTTAGFRLTPSAVSSVNSCQLTTPPALSVSTNANIEAPASLTVSSTSPLLIAAQGYIDLAQTLRVNAPLIIIAGGDLHIAAIEQASPLPSSVTLVALTGAVAVDHVTGVMRLSAIGWQGVYLPPGIPLAPSPLMPPLQAQQALSLTYTMNE